MEAVGPEPSATFAEDSSRERLSPIAWSGSEWVFSVALLWLLVWFVTGPLFGYSERWQLAANTGTTLVTFLVVFLIQREQDRDSRAIQLKLNELIAVVGGASNHLIGCEHRSAADQHALQLHFRKLAELARQSSDVTTCHSIAEAHARHERKQQAVVGANPEEHS